MCNVARYMLTPCLFPEIPPDESLPHVSCAHGLQHVDGNQCTISAGVDDGCDHLGWLPRAGPAHTQIDHRHGRCVRVAVRIGQHSHDAPSNVGERNVYSSSGLASTCLISTGVLR